MSHAPLPPDDGTLWKAAFRLHTETGSTYELRVGEDGTFWFGGNNVPNPVSRPLDGRLWRVQRPVPFPPLLGEPLFVAAPPELECDDPTRIPGGGKLTSRITAILILKELV